MYCMSVLVNCTFFNQVEKSLESIHKLFDSPYVDDDVTSAHGYLCKMISCLGIAEDSNSHNNLELNDDEETIDKDERDLIKSQSQKPFGTYFEKKIKKDGSLYKKE